MTHTEIKKKKRFMVTHYASVAMKMALDAGVSKGRKDRAKETQR